MNFCYNKCLLSFIFFALHAHKSESKSNPVLAYISANCGSTDESNSDPRIQSPWTAAIFIRKDNKSEPVFISSGSVVTPSVVGVIFGGSPGRTPSNKPYKFPKPSEIIVGLGLKCTATSSKDCVDEHTLLLEVAHIRPYEGTLETWKKYYGTFLYLNTPVQFSPYIRLPCPLFPQDLKGLSYEYIRENYPQNITSFFTGFAQTDNSNVRYLKQLQTRSVPVSECKEVYEKKYRQVMPSELSCSQLEADSNGKVKYCMGHSSLRLDKLFGFDGKSYGTGSVILISGYQKDKCSADSYYFHYICNSVEKEYTVQVFACSPKFACTNSIGCIDWDLVCNGNMDCENGEDENFTLCRSIQ